MSWVWLVLLILIVLAISLLLYNTKNKNSTTQSTYYNKWDITHPDIPPPDPTALKLEEGYKADVLMDSLIYPTSIAWDTKGNTYIAETGYTYSDNMAPARIWKVNSSGEKTVCIARLNGPIIDLLWHHEKLYISHRGKISTWSEFQSKDWNSLKDIVTDLPSWGDHSNTCLSLGPDGRIYFGQGTVTNSGVVGVDNLHWLRSRGEGSPQIHDIPAKDIILQDIKYTTPNPFSMSNHKSMWSLLNGFMSSDLSESMTASTGPYHPFGKYGGVQINNMYQVDNGIYCIAGKKPNGCVMSMKPDGSDLQVYAWGLRNPYGLKWSGADSQLYVSDQGYENRGSRPIANAPDTLNRVSAESWFGFPDFAAGVPITNPTFKPVDGVQPTPLMIDHPNVEKPFVVRPHGSNVCGLDVNEDGNFGHYGSIFMAERGTDGKSGYQIVRVDNITGQVTPFVRTDPQFLGPPGYEHVITPGLRRPVSVKFGPDGCLYIVDIGAIVGHGTEAKPYPSSGVIFKISRIRE